VRFILPSAVAARLGFNRLAYTLYARMMRELARDIALGADELRLTALAGGAQKSLSSMKPPLRRNQDEVTP
jgi:hypothetical protein